MSINQTVQSVPLKGMRQACHECVCVITKIWRHRAQWTRRTLGVLGCTT